MDSATTNLNPNQRKRNVNHHRQPPPPQYVSPAKRKPQLSSSPADNDNGGSGSSSGCHESAAMAEMGSAAEAATVVKTGIAGGCMEDTIAYLDSFPIGYRFIPTDEELVTHYLLRKIRNLDLPKNKIGDVDVYGNHPEKIVENHPQEEGQWYFFSPRNRKYTNGSRPNRKAGDGYWKTTGVDKEITDDNGIKIGDKKSLVYHEGRAPNGIKTDWLMHEYVVAGHQRQRLDKTDMKLDDCVLCKIYKKENRGRQQANPNQVVSDHQQQQHSNSQDENPTPNDHGDNNTQMFYDSSNQDHHAQGEEARVLIPDQEPRSKQAVLLPRVDQEPNPRNFQSKHNAVVQDSWSYCHRPTMGLRNPLSYHLDRDMRFVQPVAPPIIPPPLYHHPFCSKPSYMMVVPQETSDFNIRPCFSYVDQQPLPPYQTGDGCTEYIKFLESGLSGDDIYFDFREIDRYLNSRESKLPMLENITNEDRS